MPVNHAINLNLSRLQQRIARHVHSVFVVLLLTGACLWPSLVAAQSYAASLTPYSWVNPAGHTVIRLSDDSVSAELPLGFTFNYGGVSYTTARIQSNGRVQFNNTSPDYSGGTYPNPTTINSMAAAYKDLNPGAGGSVTYRSIGTAPDRQWVATWTDVPSYGNNAQRHTFQVILNEGGTFVYQYSSMSSAVYIGYQTKVTDYVVYSTGMVPTSGTAIRWSPATPSSISGRVFEDLNYGGGAGRALSSAAGVGINAATVELYNSSGGFVSNTTTNASGNYSFPVTTSGNYFVRVASTTVASTRSGTVPTLRGVMTYRTTAASGSAVAVTDFVGGTNPSAPDPATASSGATFNTSTYVYSAGLSGTAHAVTPVTVTLGTSISGLDFGFNFSTVTNVNDSGQGSLRQAITNANTLGSDSTLAQLGRVAGVESVIFMISNGTAAAGLRSTFNQTSGGVASIAVTSALPAVTSSLAIDGSTQPGFSSSTYAPIVELNGAATAAGIAGLVLSANNCTVQGVIVNRFGGNGITVSSGVTGALVRGSYIGTNSGGTAASPNGSHGIHMMGSNGVIGSSVAGGGNVLSGNVGSGIFVSSPSVSIMANRIGTNAAGTAAVPNQYGVRAISTTSLVIGNTSNANANTISGNSSHGVYFEGGNTSTSLQGNTIGRNSTNTAAVANGGSGVFVFNSTLAVGLSGASIGGTAAGAGNTISGNTGSGVSLRAGNASQAAVLGNSIYGNGGIGIDLGADGISSNNGSKAVGQPNLMMNHPVFTAASVTGSTLTVAGYVGSAAGQSLFASSRVEIFLSDNAQANGGGQTYLGMLTADASGNFSGSITVSGVTLTNGVSRITATATDSSNNTSEFGPNVMIGSVISGTVFEDLNYGGGAGRSRSASAGVGIPNATVELIGSSGLLLASTTTAADGSYTFNGAAQGHHLVRVVLSSVRSTRSGSSPSLVGVQTWRQEASWTSPGPVTDQVGGADPVAADGNAGVASYTWTACAAEDGICSFTGTRVVRYGSGSSWTTRVLTGGTACTSAVFGNPLVGTTKACQILNASLHSVSSASTAVGNVTGVDFGFNFSTVVNTNDSGAGSLRQVISNANALGGDSSLAVSGRSAGIEHAIFMLGNGSSAAGLRSAVNLFSGGVATLNPASALPAITSPLVVDAQRQPGWVLAPVVQVSGGGAGANVDGITLSSSVGSTVRGLVINGFGRRGVALTTGSGHIVAGNHVGTNAAGTTAVANIGVGVNLWTVSNSTIGGATAADRNVLSGNGNSGIVIGGTGGTGNTVQGNVIGLNAAGSSRLANGAQGIYLASSGQQIVGNVISGNTEDNLLLDTGSNNTVITGNTIGLDAAGALPIASTAHGIAVVSTGNVIGGSSAALANLISGNGRAGVALTGSGSARISRNSIGGNAGLGIDLAANGVSANDGAKSAGQPNLLMDFPVFTSARSRGNQLTVAGYVGSAASQALFAGASVEVFLSDDDASGFGEGRTWLGTLTADASGNFSGTVTMPLAALKLGSKLTATAIDGSSNTSEFGPNFAGVVFDFVVNSPLDDVDATLGDGQCLTAAGVCTLRAALAELNAWPSMATVPTIAFALPGCSSGGAVACRIAVGTALPTLTRSINIDGTTQPGWSSVTAWPIVVVNGSGASSLTSGLTLGAGTHSVRGLVINGFGQNGILASAGTGHHIAGNWIGLDAAGSGALANGAVSSATGGVFISAATNVVVGGTSAADRNVLSGNGGAGVWVNASNSPHRILGNRIGTNAAGTGAVGNGRWGVVLESSSSVRIGGTDAGEGNLISGNLAGDAGAILINGDDNQVQGNSIGLDAGGAATLPNGTRAAIDLRTGRNNSVGGNVIAGNKAIGVRVTASSGNRILANSIYGNNGLGIDLGADGVTANNGTLSAGSPNNGMDHPVISGAGVADTRDSLTVFGVVGTGTGQAAFAGARVEFFKSAADSSGYGPGRTYLGSLTADGNGQFNGIIALTPGAVAVGDVITATATGTDGSTSEFGPDWTSTTMAGLAPAGFNAFETDTPLASMTGVIRSKIAGASVPLAVVALNSTGLGLHAGFTGTVALSWMDARDDSGAASGSCRSSWLSLGSAGSAVFAGTSRVTVNLTPPPTSSRKMRLRMSYSTGPVNVSACSNDAFAVLPNALTLLATDANSTTSGSSRTLNNTGITGGVVHRAGRPFTVTLQALDATGAAMTGYTGTPTLAVTGCLLPAGCTAGALAATSVAAVAGTYTNPEVRYAEVGAVSLQGVDADYAAVDSADTAVDQRTLRSASQPVGRFVPDSLVVSISTPGVLATANGGCLVAGQGATFIGQGFGWATPPRVTVTAKGAAGNITTLWSGALMKLQPGAQVPGLTVGAAGTAVLSTSFGSLGVSSLGAGLARVDASGTDRFVLDLPAGSVQATTTPEWVWTLSVIDASEAAVSGNGTLSAAATQKPVSFDRGALFHSGRLSLSGGHGDARVGVRNLLQLQRWTSAGWVTMTEDQGCITVKPQHMGVESPSGVFAKHGDCVAPITQTATTAGGRAWLVLPPTPEAAPGRLALRLAGPGASGHSCSADQSSDKLSPMDHHWLLGGSKSPGPAAMATWGLPNRDVVLRRETW